MRPVRQARWDGEKVGGMKGGLYDRLGRMEKRWEE